MSRKLLFLEGYGRLEEDMNLVIQSSQDDAVSIVVLDNLDLYKFLKLVNEKAFQHTLTLTNIESYKPRRTKFKDIRWLYYLFTDIISEKKYLNKIYVSHFSKLEGLEIFFHSRGFSGLRFYLLKKLSKNNKLKYISHGSLHMDNYFPVNVLDLITLVRFRLTYGHDITLGKFPRQSPTSKGFAYIPDKFMHDKVDAIIDGDKIELSPEGFILSQHKFIDVSKYQVIYFDNNLLLAGYVKNNDILQRELKEIFTIIKKYFPETQIAIKYHPNFPDDKTLINTGDIVPDHIPAELLYNDKTKMYMGICSAALSNVKQGLAVSIADLITFDNEESKRRAKRVMMELSKSQILFPQSLEEFDAILTDLKSGSK